MKIVLTQPNYAWFSKRAWEMHPYTLAILNACAKKCDVQLFDPNYNNMTDKEVFKFIQETRPGNKFSDILAKGVQTYQKVGFGEEWKLHHQGGPTGYRPREYLVTPHTTGVVLDNQAVAWNPSITGTKLEDTIITTEKGPEVLTVTPKWPTLTVEYKGTKIPRPDILIR